MHLSEVRNNTIMNEVSCVLRLHSVYYTCCLASKASASSTAFLFLGVNKRTAPFAGCIHIKIICVVTLQLISSCVPDWYPRKRLWKTSEEKSGKSNITVVINFHEHKVIVWKAYFGLATKTIVVLEILKSCLANSSHCSGIIFLWK